MWGVEFTQAKNSLICGSAEFEVRSQTKSSKFYRVLFGPHNGMTIQENEYLSSEWTTIKERATPEDLEAILPQGDFMHKWTYGDFLIAMTFWGEGHQSGYNKGRWDTRRESDE